MTNTKSNVIFFHIATINNWKDILDELFETIYNSGLINEVEKIYVGLVGNEILHIQHEKIEILYNGVIEDCEFPTLNCLIDFCNLNLSSRVLYLHTKGVTAQPHFKQAIDDWRIYMSYFVIKNYKMCLEKLNDYDVCGVDWVEHPVKHFSGNFWWANASYISSLPEDWQDKSILSKRHNCEFLIGMDEDVKSCSLHNSNIDVYQRHLHRYGREKYEFGRISY